MLIWNNIGAYIGFEAIAHALNGMGYQVPLKPLTPEMITESGKQHVDMHPEAMEMNYRIDYLSRTETDCAREEGEQYVFVCKNKGTANGKKLMVLGDSFAGALMPFLNKAFSETVNAPAGNKKLSFYEELMQKYQPDVVADELIERYFSRYIKNFMSGIACFRPRCFCILSFIRFWRIWWPVIRSCWTTAR